MTSNTSVYLNFSALNSAVVVYAKQNDRLTRKIKAYLFDGSTAWVPPNGAVPVIRYKKPDGTVGFYDTDENGNPATSISGNVATLTIAEQALTVPGDVWMELNFYNQGDEKLTTFYFLIKVQQSVLDDGTIVSSDYFNALTALYSQISAIAADLPVPSTDTPLTDVAGGAVGTAANFARGDHRHPLNVDSTAPAALGTASAGSAGTYSRRDHVHPMPTAAQVGALALSGQSVLINFVQDLNDFVSGVGAFQPSTGNSPFSDTWGFVVSGGDSAYTRMQVAFPFSGTYPPKRRDLSGGNWSNWTDVMALEDSGWIEVTFTSEFKNYGTTNKCQYRKVGNVVTVCGAATPVNDIAGSNTQYTMFTLPAGFRPKVVASSIQQGSGNCRWQMQVGSGNGAVTFSRYADENGLATAAGGSPGAWLVFCMTFLTA